MKKNNRIQLFAIGFYLTLFSNYSCKEKTSISPEIKSYLSTAIDTIEANALMSGNVNWDEVRINAFKIAKDAKTTEQTYDAITYAIESLEDHHSFLQKNDTNVTYPKSQNNRGLSPYNKRMKVAYGMHEKKGKIFARIFIPQGARDDKFSQYLQDRILEMQTKKPCGWIVDLRGNGGGDMMPMVAGAGPLMGTNPLAGSKYGNGEREYFHYENGKAVYVETNGEKKIRNQVSNPITSISEDIPIAYLIDRGTASSGEIMAIIFKGRKNTMAFGEKTYGASTSTKGFKLRDSLNMVIAVATFQDRNGKLYIDGVSPDVEIRVGDEMFPEDNDPVIDKALNWLLESCSK